MRKEIYVNDELTDSAAYEYDGFGRVTKETMNGISNNYTYDLNSNVTEHSISSADSDTQSVTYAYDALNRITGISANSISRCSYEYDANGNMVLKNTYGAISQITYNNANLPVSMVNKHAATEYNSYSFAYNVDGNRINETDSLTGISKSYQYDSFDRLQHEEVSKNGTVFITEYGYDLSGNRTDQYNSNGDIMSYDYNKNNCLTWSSTMTDETGEIQEIFEYDANGNMESRQIIDGTDVTVEQYIYDASNRLIEAEKDGLEISYEYNADGLRKSKTVNGVRTEYTWDRGNMCLERTNAGTDLAADRQYVYGADGVAFSANDYTYVKNIHGDVTRVNDFLMGTQTNAYEYNSFGEITEMSETYENPFRYCGEYYDAETGWVYLRNRYYNPETGRFISEDPARDGSNWYVYCKNNPVTFVDRTGLAPTAAQAAAMADHIYKDFSNLMRADGKTARTVEDWRLIDVWFGNESCKMGIYIPNGDDWTNPSEYALVFRGSIIEWSMETIDVWKNNILQAVTGWSQDMKDAIAFGKGFVNSHSQEITFVGHSKGGAEAAGAAVATNKNALLFNPANANLSGYGLNGKNYTAAMAQYIVKKEILSETTILGIKLGPVSSSRVPSITTRWLKKQHSALTIWGQVNNHLMDAVKSALAEEDYVN